MSGIARLFTAALWVVASHARAEGFTAPVVQLDGVPYVSSRDLARAFEATRYWRSDHRRMELRGHGLNLTVTVDHAYVRANDRVWKLGAPVRQLQGDVHVPIDVLQVLPGEVPLVLEGARLVSRPSRPEPLAAAEPPARDSLPSRARALGVVVLDPGHGGADAGVSHEGLIEKQLALTLARALRDELVRRGVPKVVLTREEDRALTPEQRAESANRARPDLVLSLHFGAVPGTAARGSAVYVAGGPSASGGAAPSGTATIPFVPWRDAAGRHAASSRVLGAKLAASLDANGFGPSRVRERLPVALIGVHAPGALLECAMLSDASDRSRLTRPAVMRELANAIADGVMDWGRP